MQMWTAAAKYVRELDFINRPTTVHPGDTGRGLRICGQAVGNQVPRGLHPIFRSDHPVHQANGKRLVRRGARPAGARPKPRPVPADLDWDLLPDDTPTGVIRLLKRCLERDARRQLGRRPDRGGPCGPRA